LRRQYETAKEETSGNRTELLLRQNSELVLDEQTAFEPHEIAEVKDPYIGKTLAGRYKIELLLGSGGWGNVYLAEHMTLTKKVAIKILHQHLAKDEDRQKRLEQEAQVLSKLDNQYIIKTIDYGLTPAPFIVMEYFDGKSLDMVLENEIVEELDAIEICEQISLGLQAAHAAGLVHRDLKPSNVLISKQSGAYRTKLLDFGIAKIVQSDPGSNKLTATGEILGSPPYMSPEQWTARPTDQRSDIYSLGCLMYELLSGKAIFEGANNFEYLNLHLTETPKSIAQVAPERKVSEALENIVKNCLQKAPEDRYQSMPEILHDLSLAKEGKRIQSRTKAKAAGNKNITVAPITKVAVMVSAVLCLLSLAATAFIFKEQIAKTICENLNQQGDNLLKAHRRKDAITYFQQSLTVGQLLRKHDRRRVLALSRLANIFSKEGSFSEAQKYKNEYKNEIGDIEPPEWKAIANRTQTDMKRLQFIEAKSLGQQLRTIAQRSAGKDSMLYARSLDLLGEVYRENGKALNAINFQEKAANIAEALDSESLTTSSMLNNLGVTYGAAGNLRQAEEAMNKAISITVANPPLSMELATQYSNLGSVYINEKNYVKALDVLRNAEEVMKQLGSPPSVALKSRIGMVLMRLRRYDESIKELLEAAALRKLNGSDKETKANHEYYNLGYCYEKKGDLKKAAEYYQRCMDTYKYSNVMDSYYPMFKESYDRVTSSSNGKGTQPLTNGK
jgi:serine/threonine protein kinase/Tfp pilus assembly protein PilF